MVSRSITDGLSTMSLPTMPSTCLGGRLSLPAARGTVVVEASTVLGRSLAIVLGLPSGGSSPVELTVTEEHGGDRWRRTFARRGFTTRMRLVDGELHEALGPLGLVFHLEQVNEGAQLSLRSLALGPLRIPVAKLVLLEVRTSRIRHGGFTIDTDLRRPRLRGGGSSGVLRYRGSLR